MFRANLKRSIFTLSTAIVSVLQPAFAEDSMPSVAPDFRSHSSEVGAASGGALENVTNLPHQNFVVHPKVDQGTLTGGASITTAPAAQPLTGNLSHSQLNFPADQRQPMMGFVIETPPVSGSAVSQTVPPESFRLWLNKAHPNLQASLQLSGSAIIDVKGRWDDSSRTLRGLGFPYERIGSGELRDITLDSTKVLIVDCAGTVPKEAYQKIRDYVARGGYLLSTDWALDNLVERAFPGFIEFDRKKNSQPIYDAFVVNPEPVMFSNVVSNAHWKMDETSHLLRVLKPNSVRVLACSRKLAQEDPNSQGVLAVVFPFGRGYVMHMVGHFDNNGFFKFNNSLPDPAPAIGISLRQALASNFVVAGLKGTPIP